MLPTIFKEEKQERLAKKRAVDFLQNFYRTSNILAANGTQDYLQPMELTIKGDKVQTENVAAPNQRE